MLPIAMLSGASIYLIYHYCPAMHVAGPFLAALVDILQPLLIFAMLFLTFCSIEPKDLKLHRWHWWLLLVQGGLFLFLGLLAAKFVSVVSGDNGNILALMESAMICLICPTATAAAVVTRKLGGDAAGLTTYVILINLLTAFLVPLIVPLVHPVQGMDFVTAFSVIVAKVFPLLIIPCMAAWLVRYLIPGLHRRLVKYPDLPFYLWAFALTLAITVTTRSIMHSAMPLSQILSMALISLICCVFQFAMGRYIGSRYYRGNKGWSDVRKITAGQALGQKNTVFAIWMSYTFMTPETAIVGGLYSIWHNIYNSWQLSGRSGKSGSDK